MSIPVISESESKFTFGNGTPVRFYFNGDFQYNVTSEEQFETIRLWAYKNEVHPDVNFGWGYVVLSINDDGTLDSYPPALFGHGTRVHAETIRIKRERQTINEHGK